MSSVAEIRSASLAKEELEDLLNYLSGLPEDLRHSGAFAAYEQRAGELSREIILGEMALEMARFRAQLDSRFAVALREDLAEYGSAREYLAALTLRYRLKAQQKQKVGRAFHWGVLAASAATLISAVSVIPLTILFSGIALLLATADVAWFWRRSKNEERMAAHLATLSDVLSRSFGPSGEILRPSEYYAANTRRVEALLEEIRAQR
jgi:Flp pilus assembly protein TadB